MTIINGMTTCFYDELNFSQIDVYSNMCLTDSIYSNICLADNPQSFKFGKPVKARIHCIDLPSCCLKRTGFPIDSFLQSFSIDLPNMISSQFVTFFKIKMVASYVLKYASI